MTFLDTGFFNILTTPKNNKVLCNDKTTMLSIADEKNDDLDRYTKNIDILGMKCVIIPANVNKTHWVLYVLMNPCSILSALQSNDDKYKEEVDKKDGAPFLLYFDSLGYEKPRYIGKIYDWIFRLCMKEDGFKDYAEQLKGGKKSKMLHKKILPVINVNRALQDNGYDCGLFVCRNAYNILTSCLYDLNVSFQDIEDCQNCEDDRVSLVYEKIGKQWNYNQVDIEIFRIELRALYAKMSHVAIEPPNPKKTEKKLERKAVEESTKNALIKTTNHDITDTQESLDTCIIKSDLKKKDETTLGASTEKDNTEVGLERSSECVDVNEDRKLNDNSTVDKMDVKLSAKKKIDNSESIETCNIKGNLDKKDEKKSTARMERNRECVDGPDVRKLNDNSRVKPPAENKNDPESQDASFSCMINDKRQYTVMRGFSTRLNPILCNAVGFENGVDTRDIKLNDICTHIDTTVS